MALVEHLERFLGPIEAGWSQDADGTKMPFQIVRFAGGSGPGTVSFSTLGLSRIPLHSSVSGKEIRHELLVLTPDSLRDGPLPALIHQVAMIAVHSGHAFLRGDVVGPRGPLVPGSTLEAIYVAMPAYFPDEFASCEENGDPVAIAWLVPISAREADYAARNGWSAFEDRLVDADPDLTDFGRASLPL